MNAYSDDEEENYKVCDLLAGVTAKNRQPLLDYLRKHGAKKFIEGASFRTEEPLKGYRQWVFDALCERYRRNFLSDIF